MTPASQYLFTYGTLMQSAENAFAEKLRLFSVYEGKGYFPGHLYRITWYPGAVYDGQTSSKVFGEIYQLISNDILKELDDYEEVLEDETASLYVRKMVPVRTESGAIIQCWAYLYNQPVDGYPIIENGHFTP